MLTADQIQKIWESLEWKDLDVLNPTFNKTLNLRFARAVEAEVLRVQADAGSEILARVWYHPRPEENDYDVHDSSNFSSPPDCEKCIEALIVRGSHTHPSLPAVQGLSDDEIVGIWERVVGGPGAKPDGIDFARAILARAATVAELSDADRKRFDEITERLLKEQNSFSAQVAKIGQKPCQYPNCGCDSRAKCKSLFNGAPTQAAQQQVDLRADDTRDDAVDALVSLGLTLKEAEAHVPPAVKQQQSEPCDPTGLIARLRIHGEDRANTAFARSTMREALGVLEDQQAEPVGDERAAFEKYVASRRYGKFSTRELLRPCWEAALQFAAQSGQRADVLGPDEDGLPIARYSHRATGMAEHPNGTWVRYGEVERRLAAAEKVGQRAGVAEPPRVTDEEIESIAKGLGARWDESVWKIEDADFHPLVRALLYRYTAAPTQQQERIDGGAGE